VRVSQLTYGWPQAQAHPAGVQGTAPFQDESADTLLRQADPVCDKATARHTAVDVLDPALARVEGLVGPLLLQGERLAAGFLGWHTDGDVGQREGEEAQRALPERKAQCWPTLLDAAYARSKRLCMFRVTVSPPS
jgi:hypothetical protein